MGLNLFRMLDLAGRALSVQRDRLNVVSSNPGNANTTRGADGGPYRRRAVVLQEDRELGEFGVTLEESIRQGVSTAKVVEIVPDDAEPRRVYDPSHPDADQGGDVAYPNVNTVEEMVNMITVMRSYQANLSSLSAIKEMAEKALGLGRG